MFQSPLGRGVSSNQDESETEPETVSETFQSPLGRGVSSNDGPRRPQARRARGFQSPLGRGVSSNSTPRHGGIGQAAKFQSPLGRGVSSNPDPPSRRRSEHRRFNPLLVGAFPPTTFTLTRTSANYRVSIPSWSGRFLQRCFTTPTMRNATRVSIPSWSGRFLQPRDSRDWTESSAPGFNPLLVGAFPPTRRGAPAHRRRGEFQSPLGRGVSSNKSCLPRCSPTAGRFQSPLGRGVSSNGVRWKSSAGSGLEACFSYCATWRTVNGHEPLSATLPGRDNVPVASRLRGTPGPRQETGRGDVRSAGSPTR